MRSVDPNTHRIVVDRIRVFGVFVRTEHELHGHRVFYGNEIHDYVGRVIGAGICNCIEVGIVVRATRVRGCVGVQVRLAGIIGKLRRLTG